LPPPSTQRPSAAKKAFFSATLYAPVGPVAATSPYGPV
jgi:hypothetical protein